MSFQHGSLGASSHSLTKIKPKIKLILFFFFNKRELQTGQPGEKKKKERELHGNIVNNFMPKKLENAHTVEKLFNVHKSPKLTQEENRKSK